MTRSLSVACFERGSGRGSLDGPAAALRGARGDSAGFPLRVLRPVRKGEEVAFSASGPFPVSFDGFFTSCNT